MLRQKSFQNDNAKIYIVGTPIGNLEDITIRALETLKKVDIIYCEDTRNTARLLSHYDITKKLKSYHLFNENEITEELIEKVKNGENVAIVSDAGMPCISDPGFLAVRDAAKEGIDVVIVPGVSAGLMAVVASGISCSKYYYAGFLNSKPGKRLEELKRLSSKEETLIIYEAPHRIKETLELILQAMGDRYIVLARELTKKYEEYLRGNVTEILEVVDTLKGEMVIIISGQTKEESIKDLLSLSIKEHYKYYIDQEIDKKEALKLVAKDRNVSKSIIYQEIFGKNKEE